jgi:hypothetical protein
MADDPYGALLAGPRRAVAVTEAGPRRVEEFELEDGGRPFALVRDGGRTRVYTDHHALASRDPLLPIDDSLDPAAGDELLTRYFASLHAGDIEGTLACFEDDGYFRHSNGQTFRGHEQLRADFEHMFRENRGAIGLRFCTLTDDGTRCAPELVLPSGRPAVVVYERGGSRKLAAVRIYL